MGHIIYLHMVPGWSMMILDINSSNVSFRLCRCKAQDRRRQNITCFWFVCKPIHSEQNVRNNGEKQPRNTTSKRVKMAKTGMVEKAGHAPASTPWKNLSDLLPERVPSCRALSLPLSKARTCPVATNPSPSDDLPPNLCKQLWLVRRRSLQEAVHPL